MGRYRMLVAGGLLGAALVLGACASATAGSPVGAAGAGSSATDDPTSAPGSASSRAPSGSATSSGVNRPKKIDLTGVDPCEFARRMPLARLGLDPAKLSGPSQSGGFPGSQQCVILGANEGPGILLTVVTNQGLDETLSLVPGSVSRAETAGFPTAVVKTARSQTACLGLVDVADEQVVALMATKAFPPPVPQDQLCELASKALPGAVTAAGA